MHRGGKLRHRNAHLHTVSAAEPESRLLVCPPNLYFQLRHHRERREKLQQSLKDRWQGLEEGHWVRPKGLAPEAKQTPWQHREMTQPTSLALTCPTCKINWARTLFALKNIWTYAWDKLTNWTNILMNVTMDLCSSSSAILPLEFFQNYTSFFLHQFSLGFCWGKELDNKSCYYSILSIAE